MTAIRTMMTHKLFNTVSPVLSVSAVLSFRSGFYVFYAEMSQQFCTAVVPAKKALTVFGRENDLKTKYTPERCCLTSYECTCKNSSTLEQKREK